MIVLQKGVSLLGGDMAIELSLDMIKVANEILKDRKSTLIDLISASDLILSHPCSSAEKSFYEKQKRNCIDELELLEGMSGEEYAIECINAARYENKAKMNKYSRAIALLGGVDETTLTEEDQELLSQINASVKRGVEEKAYKEAEKAIWTEISKEYVEEVRDDVFFLKSYQNKIDALTQANLANEKIRLSYEDTVKNNLSIKYSENRIICMRKLSRSDEALLVEIREEHRKDRVDAKEALEEEKENTLMNGRSL